jgi:hypothetical protein
MNKAPVIRVCGDLKKFMKDEPLFYEKSKMNDRSSAKQMKMKPLPKSEQCSQSEDTAAEKELVGAA